VLEEAEFYNLKALIHLVKERIHNRDHGGGGDGRRLVYRVLQCHEDELANLASTLSDGWKFEQVIKVRQQDRANGEGLAAYGGAVGNQVELLCIVSKDYPSHTANGETSEKAKVKADTLVLFWLMLSLFTGLKAARLSHVDMSPLTRSV